MPTASVVSVDCATDASGIGLSFQATWIQTTFDGTLANPRIDYTVNSTGGSTFNFVRLVANLGLSTVVTNNDGVVSVTEAVGECDT